MKKIVVYEGLNGAQFPTEKKCLECDILNTPIGHIKKICEENDMDCTKCPLYSTEMDRCAVLAFICRNDEEMISCVDSPNLWEF